MCEQQLLLNISQLMIPLLCLPFQTVCLWIDADSLATNVVNLSIQTILDGTVANAMSDNQALTCVLTASHLESMLQLVIPCLSSNHLILVIYRWLLPTHSTTPIVCSAFEREGSSVICCHIENTSLMKSIVQQDLLQLLCYSFLQPLCPAVLK